MQTPAAVGPAEAHEEVAAGPAAAAAAREAAATSSPQRCQAAAAAAASGAGAGEKTAEDAAAHPSLVRRHATECTAGCATAAADASALSARQQQQQQPLKASATANTPAEAQQVLHAVGAAPVTKKCTRPGCGKTYVEHPNGVPTADTCVYHSAMPIFHDGVKKWPCCSREAWDWDEFMRIPGCARGTHADTKQPRTSSSDASAASSAATAVLPTAVKIRDIEEFNRQQQQQEEQARVTRDAAAAAAASAVPRLEKPFVTAEGKYKCINKGCNKEYFPKENSAEACRFHPGQPIFRDCMKSWTCCNAKSYDWDEFVQLPPCRRGEHKPKMVAQ